MNGCRPLEQSEAVERFERLKPPEGRKKDRHLGCQKVVIKGLNDLNYSPALT
jgi:hypothetical protein